MGKPLRIPHSIEPRGIEHFTAERLRCAEARSYEGRFGLMFKLPPYGPDEALLLDLAKKMAEAPPVSVEEDALNDSKIPSAYTVLGQFISHDLTYDPTPLDVATPPPDTSLRTACLDLDSVYGVSPLTGESPPRDGARLRISVPTSTDEVEDLPRDGDLAKIADPRNDENLLVCQLHLAFLKLHNAFVAQKQAASPGISDDAAFAWAKQQCQWHFQWVVAHDYLPKVIGQDRVNQILGADSEGRPTFCLKLYQPTDPLHPMMPLEFAVAAFRFGHSMIRTVYTVRPSHDAILFGDVGPDFRLDGHRKIPKLLQVAWQQFFDVPGVPGSSPNKARKINSELTPEVADLPDVVLPDGDTLPLPTLLAARDLQRGVLRGLPSGQAVADVVKTKIPGLGVTVLTNGELGLSDDAGWQNAAPLWFYLLKEAELQENGERLGRVGGRIVAEVILGLVKLDPGSYAHAPLPFIPAPPVAHAPGQLTLDDLLRFAGQM